MATDLNTGAFRIHKQTGFPILSPRSQEELYQQLAVLGVRKQRITKAMPLSSLDPATLSQAQRDQLRFAPQNEVLLLKDGDELWFRTRTKSWTCTFTLLPGNLVVLIAEYKHGADLITVVPPSGVPREREAMPACARREFEEETGIVLDGVDPLSGPEGLPLSARKNTERVFPFVGYPCLTTMRDEGCPDQPYRVMRVPQRLDAAEKLTPFLMPLIAYWNFIGDGYNNEAGVRDAAYAALRHLDLITLRPDLYHGD